MHPRPGPSRILPAALGVVIVALALSANSAVLQGAPESMSGFPGWGLPDHNLGPAQQLISAQSSLQAGFGPAHGSPSACGDSGPSIGCSLARPMAASTDPVGVWTNVSAKVGPGPSGRWAVMAWDATDDYVLLYGGVSSGCGSMCFLSDTWTFSDGTWTNITSSVTGTPPAVDLPGMAFDPSSGKVILFGGEMISGASVSTWAYQAKTWTNISGSVGTTPPSAIGATMVTDSTDGEIVMTGFAPEGLTWLFKDGTWTNATASAGSLAHVFASVGSDDPAVHGVLLVGGEISSVTQVATYVFSGGVWKNLTASLSAEPPSMLLGGGAYMPSLPGVVVQSGFLFNQTGFAVYASVTWEFVAGSWTNLTGLVGAQPTPVGVFGLVAVPGSESIILFGGSSTHAPAYSPYTFVLSRPYSVNASASRPVIDTGESDSFTATASGGLISTTVSWNFADGTTNATGPTVTHTFSNPGLFVVSVAATGFVGLTGSTLVIVFVNPALTVAANVSASPTAGSATYFSAVIAGGTGPFTYAWTFGDPSATSSSSAPNPVHTYASIGNYSVTLKVTDGAGVNVAKSLLVVVVPAPSPSANPTSGTGLGLLSGILVLAVIVLVVIVLALAVLLMRKPKNPIVMAPAALSVAPYYPPPPPPPPPQE